MVVDYPGDESVSTGWKLTTTETNTEQGEEENDGEKVGGVCYVNLAGLREEYGLYGGVEDSELLGGRYWELVNIWESERREPGSPNMMGPLNEHVAPKNLSISFDNLIFF